MAQNIKISELNEMLSGSLTNNTIFPAVDGGSTQKVSLITLTEYIDDYFASDSQLSNQISTVSSTINQLNTSDITEVGNLYYTDGRVKDKLDSDGVLSSSLQLDLSTDDITEQTNLYYTDNRVKAKLDADGIVSSSSQIDLTSATNYTSGIKDRLNLETVVSSSNQIAEFGFISESTNSVTASYAITASYAENVQAQTQQTDYISNVSATGSLLSFSGTGSAFNDSVDLSVNTNLVFSDDLNGYLDTASYNIDSSSFISRINAAEFNTDGTGIFSASAQVTLFEADATDFTTDSVTEGSTNKYYSNQLVKSYLNIEEVLSGSVQLSGGTGVVSGSQQITELGFVTTQSLNQTASILQNNIDAIESFNPNESYDFVSTQKFQSGIEVTGSVLLSNGSFSGSGANLSNIPASAIVGGEITNTISDGNNSVVADSFTGVELNAVDGNILANGSIIIQSGSNISGDGSGLTNISASAIAGEVAGDKIVSASFSASFTDSDEFIVNTDGIFLGGVSINGDIITNTLSSTDVSTYLVKSQTELLLSASSKVTVKDVPLNLSGLSDTDTGSITPTDGNIIYNNTSNDFYGYKSGSWVSLTNDGSDTTLNSGVISSSAQIAELGADIVSSSNQIAEFGADIVSSSTQIVSEFNMNTTEIPFLYVSNSAFGTHDMLTGSSTFTYDTSTELLTVGAVSTTDVTFDGSITGVGASSASFNLVLADSIGITNQYQLPNTDGISNQVISTDGGGNTSFQSIDTLISNSDLTTTGTITVGTASITEDLTVGGTINNQTISTSEFNYEGSLIQLRSSGPLILSSSAPSFGVQIDDVLVLKEIATKPTPAQTGSIIVSASVSGPRPFFYDGTSWTQMF